MRWIIILSLFVGAFADDLGLTPKEKNFLSERIVHVGIDSKAEGGAKVSQAMCVATVKELGQELGLWIKYEEVQAEDIPAKVLLGTLDMGCAEMSGRIEVPHKTLEYSSSKYGALQMELLQRPDWVDLQSASEKVWSKWSASQEERVQAAASHAENPGLSREIWGWIVIALGILILMFSVLFWRMTHRVSAEV